MFVVTDVCFSANGVYELFAWTQSKQSTSPLMSESETSSMNDVTYSLLPVTEKFPLVLQKDSEEVNILYCFCNNNSSHSQHLWNNKEALLHTFPLFL